jgi:apolipoprotein N-acyltransferase
MLASAAASALGGLLLALAFPPTSQDFVAWIAFIPLLQVIQSENRLGRAFFYGGIFGIAFFIVDLRWMYGTLVTHGHFAPFPAAIVFVGMILSLALFPAIFGLCSLLFSQRGFRIAIMAPFLWTSLELLRTTIPTGFPWDLAGYSQSSRLMLIQISDITGVYGVSFLVILVNASLWQLFRAARGTDPLPWKLWGACSIAVIISVVYGHYRIQAYPPEPQNRHDFTIGVLQGNIPQEIKWEETARRHTFLTYEELGQRSVQEGAQLLVWPETSVPVLFGDRDPEWRQTNAISQKLNVPMLVGSPSCRTQGGHTDYYNSAFLVEGSSLRDRYDKIHLVPFGEYMPLAWILPLGPGIAAREADYSPGDKMAVMKTQGCPPFSVLICYEAIFPDLARLAIKNGARMLINITNDGWFGDSGAPYQHLAMSGFRSIENRVQLVRAANTGISAIFDQAGRIVDSLPLQEKGVLTIPILSSPKAGSLYSVVGDVFAWSCLGICIMAGLSGWVKT